MGAALQGIFVGQGPRALPGSAGKLDSGRCGERTERCRWQRKRSERVAAVKIFSVRRKAAQKFWAPQQDHRPLRSVTRGAMGGRPQGSPLRMGCKGCGEESPSHGFAVPAPFRQGGRGGGGRIATGGLRTGFAMTLHKDHGAWRRKIAQAGQSPACAHNLMRFIWADQSRRTAVPLAVTISMPLSAPRTS